MILIILVVGVIFAGFGIYEIITHAHKTQQPTYHPIGTVLLLGMVIPTVIPRGIHDAMGERCQDCTFFPGNDAKCDQDTLARRVVYALDYGCGVFARKGVIDEFAMMRSKEPK